MAAALSGALAACSPIGTATKITGKVTGKVAGKVAGKTVKTAAKVATAPLK